MTANRFTNKKVDSKSVVDASAQHWPLVAQHIRHDPEYGSRIFDSTERHRKQGNYGVFIAKVLRETDLALCASEAMSATMRKRSFMRWTRLLRNASAVDLQDMREVFRSLLEELRQPKGDKTQSQQLLFSLAKLDVR